MSNPGGMPQFLPPPAVPPAPGSGPGGIPYGPAPDVLPPRIPARRASTEAPEASPRPGVVGVASSLSVTASLQWLCGLTFVWLVATVGAERLGTSGQSGSVFHILNRFHYRMVEGLAIPLYLVPAASLVFGLLLPRRAAWTRVGYTAVGLVALAGSAWLLRNHLLWWILPSIYIGVATAIVWTRSATAWYRRTPAG